MKDPILRDLIAHEAPIHRLPVELVTAIVLVESGGNSYSWNPEPTYRWLWDCRKGQPYRAPSVTIAEKKPPRDFKPPRGLASAADAEWWGQQASWGAMQIMGASARQMGFTGFHPRLCEPTVGIRYGCLFLSNLVRRFKRRHGLEGVVAAYNAGSPRRGSDGQYVNQSYVEKVRSRGGFA